MLNRILPTMNLLTAPVVVLAGVLSMATPVLAELACPEPGELPTTRPSANGEATDVLVGVYLNDISAINDVNQTFSADLYLAVTWRDPRVTDPKGTGERIDCPGMFDAIWNPVVLISNGRSVKISTLAPAITKDGRIIHLQHLIGEFSATFDLREFPLDTQDFTISLRAGHDATDVRLIRDESLTGRSEDLSAPGWQISGGTAEESVDRISGTGRSAASYHFRIAAKRNATFYVWKVFLPLTLIVFMSWAVFYIDPSALSPQISVAITSMLTLIAYQFALGYLLPPISYLTLADRFTLGSLILIFFVLVEVIAVTWLTRAGRLALAKRVQRAARWIFPLGFTTVYAITFVR